MKDAMKVWELKLGDPCPAHWMNLIKGESELTICHVLREIYSMAKSDPKIQLKTRIATTMAKKMSERLEEYKRASVSV